MRVTWDNVFKALSPRPGLQEALLSPLLIVISDQWKHRDVRIVGRAFPGPYSSLITPGYLILRSGLDKFHRVRWTGCYHFGSVWIVKSLLVPLLKGKKSSYTFLYREYFTMYKVFLHLWFYLNLPNDPIGQNKWLLLLLFKETNQCSRSPDNLTKVTQITEGWALDRMLAPQITMPFAYSLCIMSEKWWTGQEHLGD